MSPEPLQSFSDASAPIPSGTQSEEPKSAPPPAPLPPTQFEDVEILKLLMRMRPRRFLRQMELYGYKLDNLAQAGFSEEAFDLLIDTLNRPSESRWKERLIGAWALGQRQLTPEQKTIAAKTLCAVLENRQMSQDKRLGLRMFRAMIRFVLVGILGFSVGALLVSFAEIDPYSSAPVFFGLVYMLLLLVTLVTFLAGLFVMPISFALDAKHTTDVRARAARTLSRLCVPESVGALAKATMDSHRAISVPAWMALRNVLPMLTSDHYGQLGSEAVPNLCRVLNYFQECRTDRKCLLDLLKALEKVGDGRAIPTVRREARKAGSKQVRAEAERILLILEERQRQENAREMLLRASSGAATTTPDTLLRPAAANQVETPPEQLLRPYTPD